MNAPYTSPQLELLEIATEQGFAGSPVYYDDFGSTNKDGYGWDLDEEDGLI